MRPLITLTTDFGTGSPYVAQMKGVLYSVCRETGVECEVVDLTHAIGPQNIREGAVVLADVAACFPAGTLHVAVIDPGVGSSRKILYVEIGTQRFLVPDNGLLGLAAREQWPRRIVVVEEQRYWLPRLSQTFQGRDIFAPVAAHLACGVDPEELGPAADSLILLDWAAPTKSGGTLIGEVLWIDSFGNLISNLRRDDVTVLGEPDQLVVECNGRRIARVLPNYASAMPGEVIALFDSRDRLEVAVAQGNAAQTLRISAGEPVAVRIRREILRKDIALEFDSGLE
jgi:S-adenosylmethionine hydrolase